jgi:dual specificity tyrosine-phosphorylation-regulated kinase 2/3/4
VGDHVFFRYEIQSKLGKGAFGDVYQVFDHKVGERVALKIIRNERRFHHQGKIEVAVLKALREHSERYQYVKMIDTFTFRGHLCLTFELHFHDLYSELKSRDFEGLFVQDVQHIAASIATCLKLCRKLGIVHADLKPENVLLVDETSFDVRVIDFGSACFAHGKVHTYVQSRYYRSPEVVLGLGYGPAIDMWSLGCIIVELITGRPIFAAKNERDLLLYQMEVGGLPPSHLLDRATRTDEFFLRDSTGYKSLRIADRKGRSRIPGTRSLESILQSVDAKLLDFVRQCLEWDPSLRMTPEQALAHPFLTQAAFAARSLVSPIPAEKLGSSHSLDMDSGLESTGPVCEMSSDVSTTSSSL